MFKPLLQGSALHQDYPAACLRRALRMFLQQPQKETLVAREVLRELCRRPTCCLQTLADHARWMVSLTRLWLEAAFVFFVVVLHLGLGAEFSHHGEYLW